MDYEGDWEHLGKLIKRELEGKIPEWSTDRANKQSRAYDKNGVGVASKTIESWMAGKKPTRLDRLFVLFDTFGWDRESLPAILAGSEPVRREVSPGPDIDILIQVDRLATAIEEAAASIRRMLAQDGESPR